MTIADLKPKRRSERYDLLDDLGGGQSATHRARDRKTGAEVLLKSLRVRETEDWKAVELFEREAKVLRALDHPGIPKLLDAFVEQDTGQGAHLFLVQEYIEGRNLKRAVEDGLRVDEARAHEMAVELLQILDYLHRQKPAVIHRDIKPANIIIGQDGRLHLVDFGAVGRFVSPRGGSTIIGSAGYVPIEQLAGRALPASDLYALGATLVFMLSRRPPNELPFDDLKLQFRQATQLSEPFAQFLDHLLSPSPEARPQSVQEALELLDASASKSTKNRPAKRKNSRAPVLKRDFSPKFKPNRKPRGSRIEVRHEPSYLEVTIPGRFSSLRKSLPLVSFMWVIVLPCSLLAFHGLGIMIPLVITAIFMVIQMNSKTIAVLTPEGFRLTKKRLGSESTKKISMRSFRGLVISEDYVRLEPKSSKAFDAKKHRFGLGLSRAECNWVVDLFEKAQE